MKMKATNIGKDKEKERTKRHVVDSNKHNKTSNKKKGGDMCVHYPMPILLKVKE